jgi:hypothetical protein
MDIVQTIRTAEQNGQKLISVPGDKGVSFQIRINTKIQSGVFQKCANYSSTINEEIVILPPNEVEAVNLLAGAGEARTTLNAKTYKQFLTFFGGVSSTVSLDVPGAAAEKPKQVAGEKGETKVDSGNREIIEPRLIFLDDDFTKDSKYIYALCSVDAHCLTSNYSEQVEVTFDRFKNKLNKKRISNGGSPKAYPNLRLLTETFVDLVLDKNHKSVKIAFTPEHLSVTDSKNRDLGLHKRKRAQFGWRV